MAVYEDVIQGSEHSKVSPSSLKDTILCPGRVRMQEGHEDQTSLAAAEGTVAHKMCEDMLNGKQPYKIGSIIDTEGHDITVNQEMATSVEEYIHYIENVKSQYNGYFFEESIEDKVTVPDCPYVYGTADYILSIPFDTLYVVDFKYGKGVIVSPEENPQGMAYAMGAAGNKIDGYDKIVIVIVQPRTPHGEKIKEWETTPDELKKWCGNILAPAIETALSDDADLVPGEQQCRWCRAKHICPALAEQSLQLAQADFADFADFNPVNPETFSIQHLEQIYPKLGMLKTWIKSVEARVFNELAIGGQVEGYKLVKGRRSRSWANEAKAVEYLTRLLGDKAYERKPLSPAKAEKLLDKAEKKEVKQFIHVSEGKPVIVKQTDKRAAVTTAAEDFKHVVNA